MGIRPSRLVFQILSLVLAIGMPLLTQASDDCFEEPVHASSWNWVGLAVTPEFIGDWRLNVSPQNSTLTRVRAHLEFIRGAAGGNWSAVLVATYPSNPPEGIPYTFQKMLIQYRTSSGLQTAEADWTNGCRNPGRGILPGQSFRETVELPGTASVKNLDSAGFFIWGSEN